jgi:hypothetical protein
MCVQVRLAAGGALAIAHEHVEGEAEASAGAEGEPSLAGTPLRGVLARLEELARDSHKYRAKRDRKLQRATFRDVLKYFEVTIAYAILLIYRR